MTAREFAEWMAYYRLEPWGGAYDAYERAIIACTLANIHRDTKRKKKAYDPVDFMVRFHDRRKPEPVNLLEQVKVINRMFGGRDLTDGNT